MNLIQTPRPLRHAVSVLVLAACGLAACGGSDASTDSDVPASVPAAQDVADQADGGQLDQGEVGVAVTDVLGDDDAAVLGDAISSLSPKTRFGVVAGQLDPEPTVEVDGANIRLVFSGSEVGAASFDCIVAKVVREEGETVTVVYPDGEQVC